MSTEWNYGPGWEDALLEAYGIEPDRAPLDGFDVSGAGPPFRTSRGSVPGLTSFAIDANLHFVRLGLFRLRQRDGEHAVLVVGLRLVVLHGTRQADGARK